MLLGNLGWRLFSAIATISIARILGPRGFGELGMVRSTVQMFSVYAGFRLGNTAAKYVSEYREENPLKAARILRLTLMVSAVLCGVVSIVLLVSSHFLAVNVLLNETMTAAVAIGAFMLFFVSFGDVQGAALSGFENFKGIAKTNIIRGLLTPIVCIPLTLLLGIEGAIIGLTIVAALVTVLLYRHTKRSMRAAKFSENVKAAETWQETSVLWRFALPGFLSGVLTSALLWTGRIILTRQEAGYTELGLFTAADQWRIMVLFIPAIISRVILPIISSSLHRSDQEMRESIGIQVQATAMIALPMTLLLIGFSEPLAAIFGKQFAGTEKIIPVLMLSVYFAAINQSIRVIYDGVGRRWLNLSMWVLWGLVFIATCYHYVPQMGAYGFAVAHVLGEIALLLAQALYADLFLVPAALRKYLGLFVFSILLLSAGFIAKLFLPQFMAFIFNFLFVCLAGIPLVVKIRNQVRPDGST